MINDPNNVGAGANLQTNVYVTPRECGLGLSTCYYPTQTTNTCGPVLTADATVSNANICVDDCIDYTDLSVGPIVTYDWVFAGGVPSTFSGMNPPSVCYPTIGNYTTTLTKSRPTSKRMMMMMMQTRQPTRKSTKRPTKKLTSRRRTLSLIHI